MYDFDNLSNTEKIKYNKTDKKKYASNQIKCNQKGA